MSHFLRSAGFWAGTAGILFVGLAASAPSLAQQYVPAQVNIGNAAAVSSATQPGAKPARAKPATQVATAPAAGQPAAHPAASPAATTSGTPQVFLLKGLADVFSFLGLYSIRQPREVFALAERAARRALEIDPHAPEVQTSLALLAIGRDWDLPEAIRRLALAVELDHGQVQSRIYHAWVLVLLGQHEAALNLAHDAQELDPTSLLVTSGVAYTCFLARAYAAGVEACERSLEQDPDFIIAMYVKGMCRAQQGEFGEAIQLLERAVAMSGRAPFYVGLLGNFYGRGGRPDAARRVLAELAERSATQYVPPHAFAYVHAGLDELDAAFDWQARACAHGASPFNYFSPVIENMHGDPRHVADMFRMGWQRWPGGTAGSPLPA